MVRYYIMGFLGVLVTTIVVLTYEPLMAFVILWWFYGGLLSFGYNAVSILTSRNIPFKASGYAVDSKSLKNIMESYKDDELLIKQLNRAIFFRNISAALILSWMVMIGLMIFLSN